MTLRKNITRITITLAVIISAFAMMSVFASAETASEELEFTLNSDGTEYSVTGIGACTDIDIVIPSTYEELPVTSIGRTAFSGCSGLTSIAIPDSVTSIGLNAFSNCTELASFTVGENNEVYHDSGNCLIETATKSLIAGCRTSVIPDDGSVISVGDYAFYGCTGLTSIIIPDSITSVGMSAFYGCNSLTSVTISNNVTSIGNSTFRDCSGLASINIPDSITSIGFSAFYGCSGLTSVTIGNGVTTIGEDSFYGCVGLTEITIPNSVTSIGSSAFRGCTGLTSVIVPNGVVSIGDYVFYGCARLTEITIPNSVTSIGSSAFRGCTGLTSVTIPDGVTSIDNYVFYGCIGLTSVTLPDGITSIGSSAFAGCSGLTSITIPDSVTSMGASAFSGCTGLTSVYITDISAWLKIKFEDFRSSPLYCAKHLYLNNELVTNLVIQDSVKCIRNYAFDSCQSLTGIIIPEGVTSVGYSAFSGCTGLTSVIIPDGVTRIGEDSFYGCTGLTSIIIPDSVTIIGPSAFRGCTELTSIAIPDGATNIGDWAFYFCYALTDVYYGGTEEEWADIILGSGNDCLTNATIHYNHTHNYGEWVITIPATCTTSGLRACYCVCGAVRVETIDAPVHTEIINEAVAATCTTAGLTEGRYCSVCNTVIAVQETVSALGHAHTNGYGYTDNGNGTHTVMCLDCNTVIEAEVAHTFVNNECAFCKIGPTITGVGGIEFTREDNIITINHDLACKVGYLKGEQYIAVCAAPNTDGSYSYKLPDGATDVLVVVSGDGNLDGRRTAVDLARLNAHLIGKITLSAEEVFAGDIDGDGEITPKDLTGIIDAILERTPLVDIVHTYTDGTCTLCGDIEYSSGLEFTLNSGGTSYSVSGIGACTDTNIVIPSTYEGLPVTSITSYAFEDCSQLTTVVVPSSATEIESSAFDGCENLVSIVIPSSVLTIGSDAFVNCNKLTDVYYMGSEEDWSSIDISIGTYSTGNAWLTSANIHFNYDGTEDIVRTSQDNIIASGVAGHNITYVINDDYELIIRGFGAMSGRGWSSYNTLITEVTIDPRVTYILCYAFEDCSQLTTVVVPSSATEIESSAFDGCKNLVSIVIPSSVLTIGSDAFVNCNKLTDVYYMGSEEDWSSIDISIGTYSTGNENLLNATIHYNYKGGNYLFNIGSVRLFTSWDQQGQVAYFGMFDVLGCRVTEKTDTSFIANVDNLIGKYVWVESEPVGGGLVDSDTLICIKEVEARVGTVSRANLTNITIDGITYATPSSVTLPSIYEGSVVRYYLSNGKLLGLEFIEDSDDSSDSSDDNQGESSESIDNTFSENKYRADLLLRNISNNLDWNVSYINDYSPSQIIMASGELADINELWRDVNLIFETADDASNHAKYNFEQTDIYTAILINALEKQSKWSITDSTVNANVSTLSKIVDAVIDVLKTSHYIELAADTDYSSYSDEKKELIAKTFSEELKKSDLGTFDDASGIVSKLVSTATTIEDFVNRYNMYVSLNNVSDDMYAVLQEMLAQTPDDAEHLYMRNSIYFCMDMIESSTQEVLDKAVLCTLADTGGRYILTEAVSTFYKYFKDAAIASNPELGVILAAYKASNTLVNLVLNVDDISEKSYKLQVVNEYYDVLNKTISSLTAKYNNYPTDSNAKCLLDSLYLLCALGDVDCTSSAAFVKSVDDAAVNKIKDWMANIGIGNGFDTSGIEDYISATQRHFISNRLTLDDYWLCYLEADYPLIYQDYV